MAESAGAVGFLLKQTSAHEVRRTIREVHQGRTFFSPSIAKRQANREPASELGIGIKTVANHREHLWRSSTFMTPPGSLVTPSTRASSRAASR